MFLPCFLFQLGYLGFKRHCRSHTCQPFKRAGKARRFVSLLLCWAVCADAAQLLQSGIPVHFFQLKPDVSRHWWGQLCPWAFHCVSLPFP